MNTLTLSPSDYTKAKNNHIKYHLIYDDANLYCGNHIIFDFHDFIIPEVQEFAHMMKTSVIKTGATILSENFHDFNNGGFTGVIVLAESHFSVHVWPEISLATFDIFMCGQCNPMVAFNYMRNELKPRQISIKTIQRGVLFS